MPEPTMSDLAAQIERGFAHDERVRSLEQEVAALRLLPAEMRRMEDRITSENKASEDRIRSEIRDNKPKSPWPAVSALAAVLAVVLVIAAAIYGS